MSESGAGQSARQIAAGAEAAAQTLARKSEYALRRAASFRQGAEGELQTAQALAELTAEGWVVLHDRLAPGGGNVDHIAIGPGGVVVVDAKSWSGAVTTSADGGLRVAGRTKSREIGKLAALGSTVESVLRSARHEVPVFAVLALTQEAPGQGAVMLDRGMIAVGVRDLSAALRDLPARVRPAQVDAVVATVLAAFPAADRTVTEALDATDEEKVPAGNLFLRSNVFLYVELWSRSGHRRLYLNDVEGVSLGFKDLSTGEVTVSQPEHAAVVRGVLRNAHPGGLALSRSELPKIPVRVPGGRLLGHLGKLWTRYLVAQHWRKGAVDRLYVTHVVLEQGIFELGYIDLTNGSLHPSSDEPLADDLREPRRYLERVAERYPRLKR